MQVYAGGAGAALAEGGRETDLCGQSERTSERAASHGVRARPPALTCNQRPPRAQEVPTTSPGEEGKEVEGATRDAAKQKEEELRAAKV